MLKTLYAFTAGCPVIATLDGIKGLNVENYVHYIYFTRNDINTLVRALVKLSKDKELRMKLIENSQKVARTFTWENVSQRYLKLVLKSLRTF